MLKHIQAVFRPSHRSKHPKTQTAIASLALDWILPQQLAVGPLPTPQNYSSLHHAGIQSVVSLCAPSEGMIPADIPQQFDHARFILPDSSYIFGLDPRQLRQIVHHIHTRIQRGQAVYVHCLAGVERSPTVCASYLCLHQGLDLWEAVAVVTRQHPIAMLTEAQFRAIRTLVQNELAQPSVSSSL
ncbi:MAG TPA: dual specificity protein phosphatase [Candidatus Obscuribacterales bacterium]